MLNAPCHQKASGTAASSTASATAIPALAKAEAKNTQSVDLGLGGVRVRWFFSENSAVDPGTRPGSMCNHWSRERFGMAVDDLYMNGVPTFFPGYIQAFGWDA